MLTLFAIFPYSQNTSATSIDSLVEDLEKYEQEQGQIDSKQEKVAEEKQETEVEIERNLEEQDETLNELRKIEEQLQSTEQSIKEKEQQINLTENKIKDLEKEITDLEEEIEILNQEIKRLEKRIAKREELLKERLRSLQQSGGRIKYIEILLGSNSFSDFISRSLAVTTIMAQDKQIMEEQIRDREELAIYQEKVMNTKEDLLTKKKTQEEEKNRLESQRNQLKTLEDQLSEQKNEKNRLMEQLKEEQKVLEDHQMSLEEEEQILAEQRRMIEQYKEKAKKEIARLEQLAKEQEERERRKREEERRKQEEAGKQNQTNSSSTEKPNTPGNSGGNMSVGNPNGIFTWPTNGYISSPYGYRTYKGGSFHYGLDIAAPRGTPVVAASSGVVMNATVSPSYGNYIFIYHPQFNKTTVYAHLLQYYVSPGQIVEEGQLIGTVGNTGESNGYHLHFEVHNGHWQYRSGIDPYPFLK